MCAVLSGNVPLLGLTPYASHRCSAVTALQMSGAAPYDASRDHREYDTQVEEQEIQTLAKRDLSFILIRQQDKKPVFLSLKSGLRT